MGLGAEIPIDPPRAAKGSGASGAALADAPKGSDAPTAGADMPPIWGMPIPGCIPIP